VNFSIAQVPMVVAGAVYVKGNMHSKGIVHVKAYSNSVIDNHGVLSLDKGIIFYSNNLYDGLLRNNSGGKVIVPNGEKVTVRKYFEHIFHNTSDSQNDYYYTMSFPFKVGLSGGTIEPARLETAYSDITRTDGTPVALWTGGGSSPASGIWIKYYNSYKRAVDGMKTDNQWGYQDKKHWFWLNEDTIASLKAGEGYRIWSMNDHELDFNLKDSIAIAALFNNTTDKVRTDVKYFRDKNTVLVDNSKSEGWNILGGLNVSSFQLKDNVKGITNNVIYYFDQKSIPSQWKNIYLDQEDKVLSPYVTFFIQTDSDTTITYKKEGLSLKNADAIGFRSSTEKEIIKDVLRLTITQTEHPDMEPNPDLSDLTYIEFSENFQEKFRVGEDALKMAVDDNISTPQLWSWYEETLLTREPVQKSGNDIIQKNSFFLNRLPVVDKEIKLGMKFPQTHVDTWYVFKLDALQIPNVKEVILRDKHPAVNKDINLLNEDYFAWIGATETLLTDRFVLFVKTNATAINEEDISKNTLDVFAYTDNNTLIVKNLNNNDQIKILDLGGRVVASGIASGNEFSTTLSQKGVYLVRVKGEKSVVLKVLNK
jgi:hypothetical protein